MDDYGETFRAMVEHLDDAARVERVYGDPIERGDRTVIPVAKVAMGVGFGGGDGSGDGAATGGEARGADQEGEDAASGDGGSGFGGGGGLSATPVGALEVTDAETRFVRFRSRRNLALAALAGLVVGLLVGRR